MQRSAEPPRCKCVCNSAVYEHLPVMDGWTVSFALFDHPNNDVVSNLKQSNSSSMPLSERGSVTNQLTNVILVKERVTTAENLFDLSLYNSHIQCLSRRARIPLMQCRSFASQLISNKFLSVLSPAPWDTGTFFGTSTAPSFADNNILPSS